MPVAVRTRARSPRTPSTDARRPRARQPPLRDHRAEAKARQERGSPRSRLARAPAHRRGARWARRPARSQSRPARRRRGRASRRPARPRGPGSRPPDLQDRVGERTGQRAGPPRVGDDVRGEGAVAIHARSLARRAHRRASTRAQLALAARRHRPDEHPLAEPIGRRRACRADHADRGAAGHEAARGEAVRFGRAHHGRLDLDVVLVGNVRRLGPRHPGRRRAEPAPAHTIDAGQLVILVDEIDAVDVELAGRFIPHPRRAHASARRRRVLRSGWAGHARSERSGPTAGTAAVLVAVRSIVGLGAPTATTDVAVTSDAGTE